MITHCPICRYTLAGLPEKHRCPECGFEYNKDATAFFPPPRGRVWWVGFYGAIVIVAVFAFIYWYFPGSIGLFPVLYSSALLIGSFRRKRKAESAAVLVMDDRVDEIKDGRIVKSNSLAGINRAAWSFVDGKIRLSCGDIAQDWFRLNSRVYPNRIAKAVGIEINRRVSVTTANHHG